MWSYNSWQHIRRVPGKRLKPKPEEKVQPLLKGQTALNKYFEMKPIKEKETKIKDFFCLHPRRRSTWYHMIPLRTPVVIQKYLKQQKILTTKHIAF